MNWIKRGLLGLLLLLILAFIALWGLSHRPGHGTFELSILINRPASVVFAALTDDTMTKQWVSGIVELKELTARPAHVGTKILLTENISGNRVVMEEEIIELQPPHLKKYISRGLGDPLTQFTEIGEYLLEEKDGQTIFTMKSTIEYHSFIYRLLEPLLTPSVRKKFEGDQQRLKAILEAQAFVQ